jgi:hypothetical protein
MLKRRRGQKTLTKKELLGLLVPMWYRRTILINLTRRRRTSRRTPQRLNKQPILRRRTREIALSVVILIISPVNVRTASGRVIKKSTNMIIGEITETSRYGNILPTVLSVCHSPEWWIDTGANIHVCVDISLFSSYQARGVGSLLMGNGSHARVLGVGMVNLKLTSGKTM